MKSRMRITWQIALAVALACSGARAQDPEENSKPKPSAHAPLIDQDQPDTVTDPNALIPDTTPLTGIQTPGLGTVDYRHSYWVPGFQVGALVQPNNGASETTYLAGNVSLLESFSHSRLALNYSGGGYISTRGSQGDGAYQQLGASQTFIWRRWQLQFFDSFSYLPTSQFGFGGFSNLGGSGIGGSLGAPGPGLGSGVPDQSIFATTGPRYSNSFATQSTVTISPRGSITMSGSYGLLRFVRSGNIGSDQYEGSIGYNYVLTRKDTIGLVYRYSAYHYPGYFQAIGDHNFNLAYSRKITGRIAVQLFGGPEITSFRVATLGNGKQRIAESAGASVSYAFQNGTLGLTYNHGLTGGSGLLLGSYGDQVSLAAGWHLTRLWEARGNFGYSKNRGFNTVLNPVLQDYNTYYAGAGFDRALGRNASFSFGYTAYIQNASTVTCLVNCGSTSTQHELSAGFQWHTRPYVLR